MHAAGTGSKLTSDLQAKQRGEGRRRGKRGNSKTERQTGTKAETESKRNWAF